MVLDDVAFARLVVEGKLSSVTVTVVGGKTLTPGERVTKQLARVGLRVTRGPNWNPADSHEDGGPGVAGTLTKPRTSGTKYPDAAPGDFWYVTWDSNAKAEFMYRCGYEGKYELAVAVVEGSSGFTWAGAGKPRVTVKYVSTGVVESFELDGDAQTRVTKLATWLTQNGLAQSGGATDELNSSRWERTLVFTRADLPF